MVCDRFWQIMYPFNHERLVTRWSLAISFIVILLICAMTSSSPWFGLHASMSSAPNICPLIDVYPSPVGYVILIFLAFSFILNTILYLMIFKTARAQQRRISLFGEQLEKNQNRKHRKKIKALKTVLMVTVCFYICYLPFGISYGLSLLADGYSSTLDLWVNISAVFVCFNSSLNPAIYSMNSKSFQLAFGKLFNCNRSNNNQVQRVTLS